MNPRFTITNAIAGGLARIERARGFLDAATLSEVWLRRMSERALLLEAHHSTHIEGTRLTLDQSARLLAGEAVQAVFAFRRYEDASLRYIGIDSHPGLTHYGLYDTVVARE